MTLTENDKFELQVAQDSVDLYKTQITDLKAEIDILKHLKDKTPSSGNVFTTPA